MLPRRLRLAAAAATLIALAAAAPGRLHAQDASDDAHTDVDANTSQVTAAPSDERTQIESSGAARILDLRQARGRVMTLERELERAPSVRIRRLGGLGAPAYLQLRGAAPWHTQVLLDGLPLHGAGQPAFDLQGLDVALFDRVTVHAADAPLVWGTPLPGGAVNLAVTPSRRRALDAQASYGAYGTRRASVSARGPADRDGVWGPHLVALSWRGQTGDYPWRDDNGTIFDAQDDRTQTRRNNAHDAVQALAQTQRRVGAWRLGALATGGVTVRQQPGPSFQLAQQASTRTAQLTVGLQARRTGGALPWLDTQLQASLAYWRGRLLDPAAELGALADDRTEQTTSTRLGWQPTAYLLRGPVRWRTQGALDLTMDRYAAADTLRPPRVRSATRIQPGAAVETSVGAASDVVVAHGGVRIDHGWDSVTGTAIPQASAQTLVSPRAGLTSTLRPHPTLLLQVGGFYGVAHRAPAFVERYPDQGTSVGNPDLRPERRHGVHTSALLRYRPATTRLPAPPTVEASWTFYDNEVQDLVVWVQTGLGAAIPQNIGRAAIRGHELALSADLYWVRATTTYALTDALDRTANSQRYNVRLPQTPVHVGFAELVTRLWQVELGVQTRVQSSFYLDDAALRPVPGRTTIDSHLRWRPTFAPGVSLTAQVDDIADQRVRDLAYPNGPATVTVPRAVADWYGHPLPGRSWYLTLRWNWEDDDA